MKQGAPETISRATPQSTKMRPKLDHKNTKTLQIKHIMNTKFTGTSFA
jgi:hypothetical protein